MTHRPLNPISIHRIRGRLGAPSRGKTRDGFALVAVIWSLGLITLLGMALIVGARYRTRVASTYTSVAAAETLAESAINLGIAHVMDGGARPNVKFPLRCRLPGGERIFVTVEEETGKIDLNTASPAVLARFFSALTGDQAQGARIAGSIAQLRKPKDGSAGRQSAGPAFMTIMQLDQVEGITSRVFRAALPLITVRSGRPEPEIDAAPPALRQLLNLAEKPSPSPARGLPAGGSITIRADVSTSDGARFIREALVSLADGGKPFSIREWRRGDIGPAFALSGPLRDGGPAAPPCLRTMQAVASN